MPEPVFNQNDRVEPPPNREAGLPPELAGKSPAEIARYYQQREAVIIDKAKEAIRTNNPQNLPGAVPPRTSVTMERPTDTPPVVNPNELEGARTTLIANAKIVASKGKEYWDRFLPEMEAIMAKLDPQYRVDYQYWETAYYNLVGVNKDKLEAEKRASDAEAARIASERPAAGTEPTVPPAPLDPLVTGKILPGLGITEDKYRTATKNIAEGKWPLTYDAARR